MLCAYEPTELYLQPQTDKRRHLPLICNFMLGVCDNFLFQVYVMLCGLIITVSTQMVLHSSYRAVLFQI